MHCAKSKSLDPTRRKNEDKANIQNREKSANLDFRLFVPKKLQVILK
jgi:hypothetical protein